MIELLIAEGLVFCHLKRKKNFLPRTGLAFLACMLFAFAVPIVTYEAWWSIIMFLSMFAFTIAAFKFCFDESWLNILFCAIAGYTIQHIAFQVYDFFIVVIGANGGMPSGMYDDTAANLFDIDPLTTLIFFFSYGIVYYGLFRFVSTRVRKRTEIDIKSLTLFVIVILIVLSNVVLSSVTTYYSYQDFNKVYIVMLYIYNVFCCALTMYIQFDIILRKKLEKEVKTLNYLWNHSKEQYIFTKNNINLINMKCHDLKHQIRQMANKRFSNPEAVKEIEGVISIYDSIVKTGNEALDVILTEKSLYCNEKKIRFSRIVDGKQLNFMREYDLYALFGNLIDNAIEAVSDLPEDERTISLTVKLVADLVSIDIHNYYNKDLSFEDGLPKTTKGNHDYHGFGMKSIRRICEKYGGEIAISTENRIFDLSIVFPL